MEQIIDHNKIDDIVRALHPQFKDLGHEWFPDSIALCLRHDGKCAYCGLDLLSSQAICYHLWCLDHLLPQATYPKLKDNRENHILACRSCNNIKGAFDPNNDPQLYLGLDELTTHQRTELFERAKAHVSAEKDKLEAAFKKEIGLLKPYLKRLAV